MRSFERIIQSSRILAQALFSFERLPHSFERLSQFLSRIPNISPLFPLCSVA
ncbi:hypothetical protein GIB67_034610, partial [Kingdonia uniflora]